MKITRILTFLTVFSLILAACGAQSELSQNQAKWQDQAPAHYRFDLQIGCFCAFRDRMPLTVEIQNGEIVSIVDATGAAPTEQEMEWYAPYLGVDKVFEYAQKASTEAAKLEIKYDASLGYPTQLYVDWNEETMDEEVGLDITNLTVLE